MPLLMVSGTLYQVQPMPGDQLKCESMLSLSVREVSAAQNRETTLCRNWDLRGFFDKQVMSCKNS